MEAVAETVPTVEMTRVFKAHRSAVWAAWTDARALAQWMGPGEIRMRVDVLDLRPGGKIQWVFHDDEGEYPMHGQFVEIVPRDRLAFTWMKDTDEMAGVETLVTISLSDHVDGTEMTLVHERLPSPDTRYKHEMGWTGCLDCLEAHLAG